jgi:hypothetical protein
MGIYALWVSDKEKYMYMQKTKGKRQHSTATVIVAPRTDITCPITQFPIADPVVAADGLPFPRGTLSP